MNLSYRKLLGKDLDPVLPNDIIESLDLSFFEKVYKEIGNPAYDPRAMMKIIIYGYLNKMRNKK